MPDAAASYPAILFDRRSGMAAVRVAGQDLDELGFARVINNVLVEQHIDKASIAKVSLKNMGASITQSDLLREGNAMQVMMGYTTSELVHIIDVLIRRPEYNYINPKTVVLSGFSEDILLMRYKKSRVFKSLKYSEIAQIIANEYDLDVAFDDTDAVLPSVTQVNETDYQFLVRIGRRCGRDIFVKNSNLFFIAPFDLPIEVPLDSSDPEVHSIRIRIDGEGKSQIVIGIATDTLTGEVYRSVSEYLPDEIERVSAGSNFRLPGDLAASRISIVDGVGGHITQDDLDSLVDVISNKSHYVVVANVKCVGKPWLTPRKQVMVTGVGRFDGPFLIKSAIHSISGGQYTTEIVAERAWTYDTSSNQGLGQGFGATAEVDTILADVSTQSPKAGTEEE